ncbi:hypothetical protein [Acidisoma cladoniae]|jgi:hypothetical protein|uniref:hypothetical protein n=1 Tax=Acidisoma cladoniae TaxID=3040935 RepID=UPI00254AA5AB|nr:hypothetical protein [Acidisoma sp. PAMC 29798]
MAFVLRDLCVLAYANGFTLWHYSAREDPLDAVSGQGFFSDAGDMLTTGDMIMISAHDGGRLAGVGLGHGMPTLMDLRL